MKSNRGDDNVLSEELVSKDVGELEATAFVKGNGSGRERGCNYSRVLWGNLDIKHCGWALNSLMELPATVLDVSEVNNGNKEKQTAVVEMLTS